MSKSYGVIGGENREFGKIYATIDGVNREITRAYVVVSGEHRLCYKNATDISVAVITLGAAQTYSGSTKTQTIASVVVEGVTLTEGVDYTVSGNTGVNAGSYSLTVTGMGDYEGTARKAWSIAKMELTKPTVSGDFTYDGSSHMCSISGMNTYITQSGKIMATNAGTYTTTFTLKNTSNTCWEDGTTAAVSRTWEIAKAAGSISVNPTSLSIRGAAGSAATATIGYTGDGAISAASSNTGVATVTRSGNTVTVKSVATGSATITITLADGANYTGASCTISAAADTSLFGGFTGSYEKLSNITIDGAIHKLYRLKTSGTLTLYGDAKVWLCGGGGGGQHSYYHYSLLAGYTGTGSLYNYSGGGGGGAYVADDELTEGTYTVAIGSGGSGASDGSDTQIMQNNAAIASAAGGKVYPITLDENGSPENMYNIPRGGDGGSGGGAGGFADGSYETNVNFTPGSGAGVSTYPFGISSLKAHCAGGSGGCGSERRAYNEVVGGDGGTNGGNGSQATRNRSNDYVLPNSAAYGGGRSGYYCLEVHNGTTSGDFVESTSGSFYGAGGAGGISAFINNVGYMEGAGTEGYQGVVYVATQA